LGARLSFTARVHRAGILSGNSSHDLARCTVYAGPYENFSAQADQQHTENSIEGQTKAGPPDEKAKPEIRN